jgi:hypothetical protein
METSKICRINLSGNSHTKIERLPFTSEPAFPKTKLHAYASPQIPSEQVFHSYMTPYALIRKGYSGALLAVARKIWIWIGRGLIFSLSDRWIFRAGSIPLTPIGTNIAFYTYRKQQTYFLRKTSNESVVSADSQKPFYRVSLNRYNTYRRR